MQQCHRKLRHNQFDLKVTVKHSAYMGSNHFIALLPNITVALSSLVSHFWEGNADMCVIKQEIECHKLHRHRFWSKYNPPKNNILFYSVLDKTHKSNSTQSFLQRRETGCCWDSRHRAEWLTCSRWLLNGQPAITRPLHHHRPHHHYVAGLISHLVCVRHKTNSKKLHGQALICVMSHLPHFRSRCS